MNFVRWVCVGLCALLAGCAVVSTPNPYPYKRPGDPIFVVVTGQSNAMQVFPSRSPSPPQRNDLVWDWTAIRSVEIDGERYSQWGWQIPDPKESSTFDREMDLVTGYQLGASGGTAWGLADALSRATGRPVYMVCTAMAGQPISMWKPGEGLVGLELEMHVGNALSELQKRYPNIEFADIGVWIQGEQDAYSGTPAAEYARRWFEWRNYVEGKNNDSPWAHPEKTKWFVVQIAQVLEVPKKWLGQHKIVERDSKTVLMPFGERETIDGIHFWGDEATLYGEEIADRYLSY